MTVNWRQELCALLVSLGLIGPPIVRLMTRDRDYEDDAGRESYEQEHTEVPPIRWFSEPPPDTPPNPPPVPPLRGQFGWENAADVAVRARYDTLNRGFQLAAASFSN